MIYVLRADNRGEGVTFALLPPPSAGPKSNAVEPSRADSAGTARRLYAVGGTIITPAISGLRAVEGLQVAVPALHRYVISISVIILILLFAVQSLGAATVGAVFGPLTLI